MTDTKPQSLYDGQPDLLTLNNLQNAHNAREREAHVHMANEAAKLIARAALDAVNNSVIVTDEMVAIDAAMKLAVDTSAAANLEAAKRAAEAAMEDFKREAAEAREAKKAAQRAATDLEAKLAEVEADAEKKSKKGK